MFITKSVLLLSSQGRQVIKKWSSRNKKVGPKINRKLTLSLEKLRFFYAENQYVHRPKIVFDLFKDILSFTIISPIKTIRNYFLFQYDHNQMIASLFHIFFISRLSAVITILCFG